MKAIEVKDLTRKFNGLCAVDHISFEVNEGQIFGYLGPNGAGKTTTIRILTGQLRPTSGSARVMGCDVVSERGALKPQIGVVFDSQNLYERLSARDNLNFYARLYRVDKSRVEQVLEQVGLTRRAGDRLSEYSNGMKQRLLIARALLHEPRVLFLDEPTAGVDVELRQDMWKMVRKLNDSGVTIILTTHYIEEAEEIADRVGIISQGRLLLVEEKQGLMQKLGTKQLLIELRQSLDEVPAALADYGLELSADGNHLVYTYDTQSERTGITSLLQDLNDNGLSLKDLKSSQSSLEEIFVSLVSNR